MDLFSFCSKIKGFNEVRIRNVGGKRKKNFLFDEIIDVD